MVLPLPVGPTLSVNDGVAVSVGNGVSAYPQITRITQGTIKNGSKYYFKYRGRITTPYNNTGYLGFTVLGIATKLITDPVVNQWYETSYLDIATSDRSSITTTLYHQYSSTSEAIGKTAEFDNILFLNLTSTFGEGNEPTKEEMDKILTFYPNSFFNGTVNLAENKKMLKFLLNEIRSKASKVQDDWISPTLLNGWTEVSGWPVRYRKNSLGKVEIKGRIAGGAIGSSVMTLPSGYRTAVTTKGWLAHGANSNPVVFQTDAGGLFGIYGTAYTSFVDLSGISLNTD